MMCTMFDMLVCDIERRPAQDIWENICSNLAGMDGLLSRFSPESEVYKINEGLVSTLSPDLQTVLEICSGWWLRTGGLFDITKHDFRKLRWSAGAIDTGGEKLDFGGMGKGLALKYIQDLMESRGVTSAFVDFGSSSILAMGSHPFGPCWKTSVANPDEEGQVCEVCLKDNCLSVSGNRPSYSGHIINPGDGTPVNSRRIVTVVGRDPLEAEVLSTAMMIATPQERESIMENFPETEVKTYDL